VTLKKLNIATAVLTAFREICELRPIRVPDRNGGRRPGRNAGSDGRQHHQRAFAATEAEPATSRSFCGRERALIAASRLSASDFVACGSA
jgi:hypothetical protein